MDRSPGRQSRAQPVRDYRILSVHLEHEEYTPCLAHLRASWKAFMIGH